MAATVGSAPQARPGSCAGSPSAAQLCGMQPLACHHHGMHNVARCQGAWCTGSHNGPATKASAHAPTRSSAQWQVAGPFPSQITPARPPNRRPTAPDPSLPVSDDEATVPPSAAPPAPPLAPSPAASYHRLLQQIWPGYCGPGPGGWDINPLLRKQAAGFSPMAPLLPGSSPFQSSNGTPSYPPTRLPFPIQSSNRRQSQRSPVQPAPKGTPEQARLAWEVGGTECRGWEWACRG